jgi:thiamine biosynthesis lipoprotein
MTELRRMRPLLGTFVEVGARGPQAGAAAEAAFAAIERAQALWSFHDGGSELSRLNRRPGERVALSATSVRLLRVARALMQASAAAFDCTVGGALVLDGTLPDHGGPEPLPHGDAQDIDVGPGWALLRRPIRVTLDGIAKGFAVDLAVGALRRQGAQAGWINAGGDLRAFGDVTLPVQRRELDGRHTALGGLRDAAVATSAVAPNEAADASFPGRIVATRSACASAGVWTVLARSAWRADALTKVAACAPASQRSAAVARLGGCLIGAAR